MATKTKTTPALKRGEVLKPYARDEYDVRVEGFADKRSKIKVISVTGSNIVVPGAKVRLLANDVAKLRRRYRLPARLRRSGSQSYEIW